MSEVRLIDANALMEKVCGNCQQKDCVPDATDTVYGCMFAESVEKRTQSNPNPCGMGGGKRKMEKSIARTAKSRSGRNHLN